MWSVDTSSGCVSTDYICLGCCYFPVLPCLIASWFPSCSPWWPWAGLALFVISSPHSSFKKLSSLLAILWNSTSGWVYLSLSPLPFTSLLFSITWKAFSDNHFAFLHFFFFGMVLVTTSCTMLWPPSVVLQALCRSNLIPWIYLSPSLYNHKEFDLGHTWMSWWFSLLPSI